MRAEGAENEVGERRMSGGPEGNGCSVGGMRNALSQAQQS